MGIRIKQSGDPAKPRLIQFTDLRSGKAFGAAKLPARKPHRKSRRRRPATTLKLFVDDVYAWLD